MSSEILSLSDKNETNSFDFRSQPIKKIQISGLSTAENSFCHYKNSSFNLCSAIENASTDSLFSRSQINMPIDFDVQLLEDLNLSN